MESQEQSGWNRIAAVSGIVTAVLLAVGGFVFSGGPDPNTSAQKVAAIYADHHTGILTDALLNGLGTLSLFVFAVGLFSLLRRAEGGSGILAFIALAGSIATVPVVLVWYGIQGGIATIAKSGGDPGIVVALNSLQQIINTVTGLPIAAFLAAASLVIMQTRCLPPWVGWLGLVAALCNVVAVGAIYNISSPVGLFGFLGFVLFLLWLLATSITLLLLARAGARQPAFQ